ncbi:dermonecrotic toxin domain-containing protein [Pseudomonas sp. NPDC089406]|uniref:dermonecrotic toxin domain-containing protein n=1 Tax=Pseudomonas sp. NPDC089406 TaxID=3364463 RepID=UPI00384B07A2
MNDQPATHSRIDDSSAHAIIERLGRWSAAFEQRRHSQLTFIEAIESDALVQLRTYYAEDIDPNFIQDLLDAALQRMVTQESVLYDEAEHGIYHISDGEPREVPLERRQQVEQLAESIGGRMVETYRDYLTRHWETKPHGLSDVLEYQKRISQCCEQHCIDLEAALGAPQVAAMTSAQVRALIREQGRNWHAQPALLLLADADEKQVIDRLVRKHLPQWYRNLNAEDAAVLSAAQGACDGAQSTLENLLGSARSLREHAGSLACVYLHEHFDLPLSADLITVKCEPSATENGSVRTLTLTELVMEGAIDVTQVYKPLQVSMPLLHCKPPSAEQLQGLLSELDAPHSYVATLKQRHQDAEVGLAQLELYDLQLRYSLLLASKKGHVSGAHHDQVMALLAQEPQGDEICPLQLWVGADCSDLLLFAVADDAFVLYAPGKPDGQEWIELVSQRALNSEIGSWLAEETGRHYLLSQVPFDQRATVSASILSIVEKPSEWSLSLDRRRALTGYQACLAERVRLSNKKVEDEVEAAIAPHYALNLNIGQKRVINLEKQVALQAEHVFAASMQDYEGFHAFARRTVETAIKPYLADKGITEQVDPESILFDLPSTDTHTPLTMNLVDLVCYGYDDNSGLDNPKKGVRSLVGQDLSALRSHDFTRYARRAYVGEKYITHIREHYLDESSADYAARRRMFGRALISAMDRDLRLASIKAELDQSTYMKLIALVTALGRTLSQPDIVSESETVVESSGVFRLSIDGCFVLGVYVLRDVTGEVATDWLYTPDAPDSVLLRPYQSLNATGTGVLYDYLLNRVTLTSRAKVSTRLKRLASGDSHRDSLRGLNQVVTVAGEYNAFIEHALADVEDATLGKAEVIRAQVFKGVLFSALPLLVYPPFAITFTAFMTASALKKAIIAHTRWETAVALQNWLEASWSLLGAVLSVPGVSLGMLKSALVPLRQAVVRHPQVTGATRAPSLQLDNSWAVKSKPGDLHKVIEDGIWKGTYRSGAEGATDAEHFIHSGGRYYKVTHDVEQATLRVFKANRPLSYHRQAVRLHEDGRWVANSTGLRGGDHVQDAGTLTQARQITNGEGAPSQIRGALQGEAVVARYAGAADDYLYTVNAQSCVAVSLYNPATRAGAVLHVDHNVRSLIEPALRQVLTEIGAVQNGAGVRAVMAGGDWLGGVDVGGVVRTLLRRQGIQASWQHWSFSSCFGGSYGMTLNLGSGVTRVYRTPARLVEQVLDPIMRQANFRVPGVPARAFRFKSRFRVGPLYERSGGVVEDAAGLAPAPDELALQAISVVSV